MKIGTGIYNQSKTKSFLFITSLLFVFLNQECNMAYGMQEPQRPEKVLKRPKKRTQLEESSAEKIENIFRQKNPDDMALALRESQKLDPETFDQIEVREQEVQESILGTFLRTYQQSEDKDGVVNQFIQDVREQVALFQKSKEDQLVIDSFKIMFIYNLQHIIPTISVLSQPHVQTIMRALDAMKSEISRKASGGKKVPAIKGFYDKPIELTEGELLAGGKQDPVELVQKKLSYKLSNKATICFQFNKEGDVFNYTSGGMTKPSPCFELGELKSRFGKTKEAYTNAILKLHKNAYRSIRDLLSFDVEEKDIDTILGAYLTDLNVNPKIDEALTMLDEHDIIDLKKYMLNCSAVYTDFYTRNFLHLQDLPSLKKVYQAKIDNLSEITRLRNEIEKINDQYTAIRTQESKTVKAGTEAQGGRYAVQEEALSLDPEKQIELKKQTYPKTINEINVFLKTMNEPLIEDTSLENIQLVRKRLNELKLRIDSEFSWYFETVKKRPEEWALSLGKAIEWASQKFFAGEQEEKIPEYLDTAGGLHQLTPKAVVATAFMYKSQFEDPENITILDIGFRNEESIGGMWNSLMTKLMGIKAYKKAWFENRGEVDFIAYIEKDTTPEKKDKLVIVFSGSNSDVDWGVDLTSGSAGLYGLNVHQGIAKLFEASFQRFEPAVLERLQNYYAKMSDAEKPNSLEIITTGHSLGAAEALIAAHYYKTVLLKKYKKMLGGRDVTVKSYTFAAPAIIQGDDSVGVFEDSLGVDNVYRAWITNDPVVTKSELVNKWLEGGMHVGKSIPLHNLGNVRFGMLDIMEPHQARNYLSFIDVLLNAQAYKKYDELAKILNDYIRSNNLYIYKNNLMLLNNMITVYDSNVYPNSYLLHQGLAEHILKYAPTTFALKPYESVEEILVNSPRYAAALSPRFEVEVEGPVTTTGNWFKDRFKITPYVNVENRTFPFEIVASTNCSTANIKSYFNSENQIDLDDEQAEKFSCGFCLAKRVFVSQYTAYPSAYHGGGTGIGRTPHQDTLTRMFGKCVAENACTKEFLIKRGEGKNNIELAKSILEEVNLKDEFLKKKVYFTRFEKQDQLNNDIRTGIDIVAAYGGQKQHSFDPKLLEDFMRFSPQDFEGVIFSDEDLIKKDFICQLIILASKDQKNAHKNIQEYINIDALVDLFHKVITSKDEGVEINVDEIYNNFVNNLIIFVKKYYEQQYAKSSFGSRPDVLNEAVLKSVLMAMKNSILTNASKVVESTEPKLLEGAKEPQRIEQPQPQVEEAEGKQQPTVEEHKEPQRIEQPQPQAEEAEGKQPIVEEHKEPSGKDGQ